MFDILSWFCTFFGAFSGYNPITGELRQDAVAKDETEQENKKANDKTEQENKKAKDETEQENKKVSQIFTWFGFLFHFTMSAFRKPQFYLAVIRYYIYMDLCYNDSKLHTGCCVCEVLPLSSSGDIFITINILHLMCH